MSTTTLLSKVRTALQLLAEVQQALADRPSDASNPPSEDSTKPPSEELPTTSEELRTPTENTESKPRQRSEKQVATFKANFQKRWGNKTTSKASIFLNLYYMPFVPKTETTDDLPFTPNAKPIEEMNNEELTKEIDQLYKDMDTYMTLKANKPPTPSQHQAPQEPSDELPELTEDEILRIVHESHTDPVNRPSIYDSVFE